MRKLSATTFPKPWKSKLELFPLKVSTIIGSGDSVLDSFLAALGRSGLRIRNRDVVAVASKVVAVAEGRLKPLDNVRPARQAYRLARRYSLTPKFAQAVIDEADEIYGGVKGALLTLKNGEATANAGIDQKNAPKGTLVLWPTNPDAVARGIRESLEQRFHRKNGVVIVDSRVAPMRLGTVGVALGSSGIETVADLRGKKDLYGRRARITLHALADDIASAAHLVMGEEAEAVPFVLVRGAPAKMTNRARTPRLAAADCLFMSQIAVKPRQ